MPCPTARSPAQARSSAPAAGSPAHPTYLSPLWRWSVHVPYWQSASCTRVSVSLASGGRLEKHCFSWSCKNKPDKRLLSGKKAQNLVPADTNLVASPPAPCWSQRWVQTSWLGTSVTNHPGLPKIPQDAGLSVLQLGKLGCRGHPPQHPRSCWAPPWPSSVPLYPPNPVTRPNFSPPSKLP